MTLGTIGAFFIARKSLKETQKTRRDSFMPLVIPRGIGWEGKTISTLGKFVIENCGRGPAWNITVRYPDGQCYNIIPFLHNEKFNIKECYLPWPDYDKCLSPFIVVIIYHDVFHNELRLRFPVTIGLEGSHKVLKYDQKDGFELLLPEKNNE
jgi:hypothetical protein